MANLSTPTTTNGLDEKQQQILDHQQNGLPTKRKPRTIFHYATTLDFVVIGVSSFAAIVAGAFNPTLSIFYGQLAGSFSGYQKGTVSSAELRADTSKFSLYWVYLGIETFIAVYISTTGFYYTGERITRRLREAYLKTIIRQNMAFFDTLGAGELTTRITSDISLIQEGLTRSPTVFLTAVATFTSAFVIAYVEYWKLALILSSTLVVLAITGTIGVAYPVRWTKQSLALYGRGATIVEEAIGSIRHVTAFGIQEPLVQRYDDYLKQAERPALKGGVGTALTLSVMNAIPFLTFGLAFWEGSRLLVRGEMSTAAVITSTLAIILATWSLELIAPNAKATLSSIASASSILKSISRQSSEDPFSKEGIRPKESAVDITFRDIQLFYPSRPDVPVLSDLNLVIPAFKTTAIVGASGCGKSSIVGLLERFYAPTRGEIFLGHDNIRTLNLNWLRSQISLVGQEPTLFSTTIFQNIVYGLGEMEETLTADEIKNLVQQAATTANAHEFILRLENGYETDVGEKGMQLSGGQRQRICIARAIIKNPRILLLDEATSALDVEAERLVQKALAAAAKGRTTVVIAHRLSTIRDADSIIVMSDGHVVEQGTHEELLVKGGPYAELVEKQKILKKASKLNTNTGAVSEKVNSDSLLGEEEGSDRHGPTVEVDASLKTSTNTVAGQPSEPPVTSNGVFSTLGLVLRINRAEMAFLVPAALLAIILGLSVPAQSLIFAKVINALSLRSGDALRDKVNFWSLMFLALGLGVFVVWVGHSVSFAYTEEKLIRRTRYRSFKYILRQNVGFFDQERSSVGLLTSLVSTASTDLNGLGGSVIGANLTFIATIVGGIVLSLIVAWKLALVCIATVPIVAGFGWVRLAALTVFGEKIKKTHQDSATYASEAVSAIRTVASFNMEARVMKHYNSILTRRSKESIHSILVASAFYAASFCVTHFCAALAFWYGGSLIAKEHYSVFQFFVCFAALISGAQSAGVMLSYASGMSKAIGAAKDLNSLFERHPEIDTWDEVNKEAFKDTCAGKIEFRDVSFSYPSRNERCVLQNINITVHPGQYIALVGPSGCGKSTLIALLERFYDPTEGHIFVDDQEISKLNVNQYRNRLSLVSQEQTLYSGTIRENLVLGVSATVSEQDIERACHEANIYDFIISLPDGFSTEVGSKGVMLSGGQRQRMAIARAILRNTTILLLDEATAALDATSERMVQDAIDKAVKKRTTIAVAHRLSTVQNADVIYVLKEGRIVEVGNHKVLMEMEGGIYRGLVDMQSLDEAAREI